MVLPITALDANGTLCPGLGEGHDLLKKISEISGARGRRVSWWLNIGALSVSLGLIQMAL